jgi:hypothetical protein
METGFRIRSCLNKILDNDPIQLNRIIVYTPGKTTEKIEPFGCAGATASLP